MTLRKSNAVWLLCVLSIWLAGCNGPAVELTLETSTPTAGAVVSQEQDGDAPVTATLSPLPPAVGDATSAPTVTPLPLPSPTPTSAPDVLLPAPLYFLADGQIMRLENDGVTLTQLTQEEESIIDFDVSPRDARLVYIAGNTLVEADPQFGTRIVKVEGEAIDRFDGADLSERALTNPRFSPDGSRIAFGLNGVNLMAVGDTTEYGTVLVSDPYPDPNEPPRQPVRFFRPDRWSPDGRSMSVEFNYWPEAGGLAILDLTSGELTELNSEDPNSVLCCDWAWSRDGRSAYIASALLFYGNPGIAQVDSESGETRTLIQTLPVGEPSEQNPVRFFRGVFPAEDGLLYTFVSEVVRLGDSVPYALYSIDPESLELTLRNGPGPSEPASIRWARDGSGAAVVDSSTEPAAQAGPILWMPIDGSEIVTLPANGARPRWGVTEIVRGAVEPEEVQENRVEALVLLNVRSGPGTAYPVIGDLAVGEEAEILGVDPTRAWWQIRFEEGVDERGWVIGDDDFTRAVTVGEIAVVEAPPLPQPVGRIYFSAAAPDTGLAIYVQDVEPNQSSSLVISGASQPALYNDGRRLALRSSRSDLLGIGIYDLSSGELERLSSHPEDSLPNWSPNGERFVFASTRHGDRRWRIYLQNRGEPETAAEFAFGLDPSWHPTLDLIAYKGCDDVGERCGIWLADSSGGDTSPLTQNKTDSRPVWSPDGGTVVFMSESRHGNWEVYTVAASGTGLTRLTSNDALDGLPTVSPDGSRVAFVSNRNGSWGIWIVPISGGVAERVITIGADLPNWLEQGIDWAR